jgi:hypothetical protein
MVIEMKYKILIPVLVSIIITLLEGCEQIQASPSPTSPPTSTLTPIPTTTSSLTPSLKPSLMPNLTPSLTPTPQTLGRIFPEGFHGQAVWSNAGGNLSRNYKDTGWFCPPDGSTTYCSDHVIHFDVSLPTSFSSLDYILSPVNGKVDEIYSVGEGQFSIVINPSPPFAGIETLLNNQTRIDVLAKGVFYFKYAINDVTSLTLHIAHVIPLVQVNEELTKGKPIATVFFGSVYGNKVAYVIYIHMRDGTYWQFSPCDVPNEDEFCGKCTPGSPYPCP